MAKSINDILNFIGEDTSTKKEKANQKKLSKRAKKRLRQKEKQRQQKEEQLRAAKKEEEAKLLAIEQQKKKEEIKIPQLRESEQKLANVYKKIPSFEHKAFLEGAKKAFEVWANTPPLQRARVMFKFKELIEKNE